ncbi:hypothetical protein H0H93_008547 [Arthromyces matolae]|nr:hypothetical protein H0H93_008547 [Arthromyces matolae]
MPELSFPPFPDDVPTHPLLVVDYELILARDVHEVDKLWNAATQLGFWYLKNHGVDEEVDGMFDMGKKTMELPLEEKMRFEQGDEGMSFGYKAAGANAVDATGRLDTVEFINIAKDDAFAWPKQARRAYPSTVNERMDSTIVPFVKKSLEINNTILDVLNDKLGLPFGTFLAMHEARDWKPYGFRVSGETSSAAIEVDVDVVSLSSIIDWEDCKFLFRDPIVGNM